MKSKVDTCNQLNNFIQKNKCSKEAWNNRALNPSETELCDFLNGSLNDCGQILIQLVNK